jgi:hypothetical protein
VDEVHVVRVRRGKQGTRVAGPGDGAAADARAARWAVLTDTVEAAARRPPSVVFAFCSGMARLASLPALESVPLVHDMVDVDSAKWSTLAVAARWPLSSI